MLCSVIVVNKSVRRKCAKVLPIGYNSGSPLKINNGFTTVTIHTRLITGASRAQITNYFRGRENVFIISILMMHSPSHISRHTASVHECSLHAKYALCNNRITVIFFILLQFCVYNMTNP